MKLISSHEAGTKYSKFTGVGIEQGNLLVLSSYRGYSNFLLYDPDNNPTKI